MMGEAELDVTFTFQNDRHTRNTHDGKPGETGKDFRGENSQRTEGEDDNSSAAMDDFLEARLRKVETASGGETSSSSSSCSSSSSAESYLENLHRLRLAASSSSSRELAGPVTPPPEESSVQDAITPTPIYNPYTNYSPNRPARIRKEIMGMSIFPSAHSLRIRNPYEHLQSDHALENYAEQIRAELRYAEMVELAVAAERAAEEGQESFAARPSTYGMEEVSRDDENLGLSTSSHLPLNACPSPNLKRPEWRRHRSLPGRNLSPSLLHNTPSTKLAVTALRDVLEVFPSFQLFHTHLRTHLVRDGVKQKTLIFQESSSNERRRSQQNMSPRSSRLNFLRGLDIQDWVGGKKTKASSATNVRRRRSNSFQRRNEEETGDRVGELLAGHLHSKGNHVDHSKRPQIKVPPGLVAGESNSKPFGKSDLTHRSGSGNTLATTAVTAATTDTSSEEDDLKSTTKAEHHSNHPTLAPRALFNADNDDEENEGRGSKPIHALTAPTTPGVYSSRYNDDSNDENPSSDFVTSDFVTPARLRDIRGKKTKSIDPQPSLLLPTNSVIESPERIALSARRSVDQPLLDIDEAIRESDSRDSSIRLPMQLSRELEMDSFVRSAVSENEIVNLSSSKAGDFINLSGTDDSSLNTSSFSRQRGSITPPPLAAHSAEAPRTPSRQSTDALLGSKSCSKSRKVKVSVYGTSPATPKPVVGYIPERMKILQQSQLLQIGEKSKHNDSVSMSDAERQELVQTPQKDDCGCLSLSPTASVESEDSFSRRKMFASVSPTALKAMEDPRLWNPFNDVTAHGERRGSRRGGITDALYMFTRMSPKSKVFESKKRPLYYPSRENDDFLNNYLYCSKPGQQDGNEILESSSGSCAEHLCNDNKGGSCSDLVTDGCCAAILGEAAMDLAPRRTVSQRSFVSLGGPGTTARSHAETWFDMATERFDNVIEHLTGSVQQQNGSPWNISFQAPTLKKKGAIASSMSRSFDERSQGLHAIAEKKSDDALDDYIPGGEGGQFPDTSREHSECSTDSVARAAREYHLSRSIDPVTLARKETKDEDELDVSITF